MRKDSTEETEKLDPAEGSTEGKGYTGSPGLIPPDGNSPERFRIKYGSHMGAVVIQRIDNKEYPLAFASRLLKGCELNYSVTEKEGLQAVWAIKKFQLVWGCEIIAVTDH